MDSDQPIGEHFKPQTEQFDNGLETNIYAIAEQIFAQPPGPPYSIGLELDHDLESDEDPTLVVHEILTNLLIYGAHFKYGAQITLEQLSSAQLATLREYILSVGFEPILHRSEDSDEGFEIEFTPYKVQL